MSVEPKSDVQSLTERPNSVGRPSLAVRYRQRLVVGAGGHRCCDPNVLAASPRPRQLAKTHWAEPADQIHRPVPEVRVLRLVKGGGSLNSRLRTMWTLIGCCLRLLLTLRNRRLVGPWVRLLCPSVRLRPSRFAPMGRDDSSGGNQQALEECRRVNVSPFTKGPPKSVQTAANGSPGTTKSPSSELKGDFIIRNPGGDLLSQGASPQVPSARAGLTAVFGMGTGVSPPPWPPETVRSTPSAAH